MLNLDADLVLNTQNQMHMVEEYLKLSIDLGNVLIKNYSVLDEHVVHYFVDYVGLKLLRLNTDLEPKNETIQHIFVN